MRAAAWLVLFALLAGCARDPPPIEPGQPVYVDADVPEPRGFADLRWDTVATQEFLLTPAEPLGVGLTLPPNTLAASANLTLAAGAAYGLGIEMDDCRWWRDAGFVAGQAFAVDCGGVAPGSKTLYLTTTAGTLKGRIDVVALVCDADPDRLPCPAPMPVTDSV